MRQEGGAFRSYEAVVDGRYGVRSGDLQCVESEDGRWMRIADCRHVLFDRDWIMNIRIQPREQVEYELRSADCRFAAGSVSRTRGGDRKSTRLNSSHVASSYAVLCSE